MFNWPPSEVFGMDLRRW
ncbi:hypothetical protein [Klebsiella oxytoca]